MFVIGILGILLVCFFPVAVIIFIISAVAKRNKEEKGDFEESIRNKYIYIILIISLITIISGVISAFRTGLDILLPEETEYSYEYEEQDRNRNIIEFTTTTSLVISAIPIFIYHNKLVKKEKDLKVDENN